MMTLGELNFRQIVHYMLTMKPGWFSRNRLKLIIDEVAAEIERQKENM